MRPATNQALIIVYQKFRYPPHPVAVQTKTCLTCTRAWPRESRQGSVPPRNDFVVHRRHKPRRILSARLMAKASINDTSPHFHPRDIRLANSNRRSHMPLPKGNDCDDCHNPHGTLDQSVAQDQYGQRDVLPCHVV